MPDIYKPRSYLGGAAGQSFTVTPLGRVFRYLLEVRSSTVQHLGVTYSPAQPMLQAKELPYQATNLDSLDIPPFLGGAAPIEYWIHTEELDTTAVSLPGVAYDSTTSAALALATTQYGYTAALIGSLGSSRRLVIERNGVVVRLGTFSGAITRTAQHITGWGLLDSMSVNGSGNPSDGAIWVMRIEGGAGFDRFIAFPFALLSVGGSNKAFVDAAITTLDGMGIANLEFRAPTALPVGTP